MRRLPARDLPLAALICGVLIASLAAGCGSDSSAGTTSSNTSDIKIKADFIKAANAACESRSAQMQGAGARIFAKTASAPPKAAAEQLVEKVLAPGFKRELRDLRELEPPPGDEAKVEELTTAIQGMVTRMQKDFTIGREHPYRKTENLAAAYGLPACGHP